MISTNQNWITQNLSRSYPLQQNAVVPEGIIADCMLVIHGANCRPYLRYLSVGPRIISLVIGDDSSTPQDIAFVVYDKNQGGRAKISECGSFGIGGYMEFHPEAVEFAPRTFTRGQLMFADRTFINLGPKPIQDLSVSGSGSTLTGDVQLLFRSGFDVSISEEVDDVDGGIINKVTISLANPKSFSALCTPADTTCDCEVPPIKQINSVPPDSFGNINIVSESYPTLVVTNVGGINTITIGAAKESEAFCEARNMPNPDGTLPGEEAPE